MIVASFWVHRPEEFPNAADYPAMLRILQRSCGRLGLRHIVLTDQATRLLPSWPCGDDGQSIEARIFDLPSPLMKAVTLAQAHWLWRFEPEIEDNRTFFVGADCILLKKPKAKSGAHVTVTYRHAGANYPINTGAILINKPGKAVRALFDGIADRCGERWGDDQRAIRDALRPLPDGYGIHHRAGGLAIDFSPMWPLNYCPRDEADPADGAVMVHFRGQRRKDLLFEWAKRHGFY